MSRKFSVTSFNDLKPLPLLFGVAGPSGSGKTYSALRVATGIKSVQGKPIFVIDTENKRALHYAKKFEFNHIDFTPPFGSLDYLEAIDYCVKQGAGTIVIDSMSHEHEGEGGLLEQHDAEVQRMSGGDARKAENVKMAAWIKPKANRRKLLQYMVRSDINVIMCFRCKETSKPIRKEVNGTVKTVVENMGYTPIGGEEFLFEMTCRALLQPNAGGVPCWDSVMDGEKLVVKMPEYFKDIFKQARPLDEEHGKLMAQWAASNASKPSIIAPTKNGIDASALYDEGQARAESGTASLEQWFKKVLTPEERAAIKPKLDDLKALASIADAQKEGGIYESVQRN